MPARDATLILYDDAAGRWGPMADLRAAFELRCGVVSLRERIERVLGARTAAAIVPPGLAALVAERLGPTGLRVNAWPEAAEIGDRCYLVNGRWLALEHADAVRELPPGGAAVDAARAIVAARLTPEQARDIRERGQWPAAETLKAFELPGRTLAD